MNKNLTNEYKDLMEQETATIDADALWSRIEAALPEKDIPDEEVSDIKVTDNKEVLEFKKKKNVKLGRILSWSGAAVAVCAMAMIVVSNGLHLGGRNSAPTMVESAEATYDVAEEAACESAAEIPSDRVVTNNSKAEKEESPATDATMCEDDLYECFLEFEIIEEKDEYFICLALSTNDFIEQGYDFYLKKEDGLVAGDVYSGDLIFIEEIDEMKYFEILK